MGGPGIVSMILQRLGGRAYTRSAISSRICATGFGKDGLNKLVCVVVAIGVIEAFGKSVDEDSRVRVFERYQRIGTILMFNGQEDISDRVFTLGWILARCVVDVLLLGARVKEVVADDGMNLGLAEETTPGFEGAEHVQDKRRANGDVDANLDGGENCYDDTCKEDGYL